MTPRPGRDRALQDRRARPTSRRPSSPPRTAQSVLGTYSIDENGDTTLTDYGVYAVKDGELKFDQTDQGAGRLAPAIGPPHIGVCSAGSGSSRSRPVAFSDVSRTHDYMEAASIPAGPPASQRIRAAHRHLRAHRSSCSPCRSSTRSRTSAMTGNLVAPRREPRRRHLQRRHLGAGGDRLHARLRHRRADQLRPRRGLHDRLVHLRRRSSRRSGCTRARAAVVLFFGLLLDARSWRWSARGRSTR